MPSSLPSNLSEESGCFYIKAFSETSFNQSLICLYQHFDAAEGLFFTVQFLTGNDLDRKYWTQTSHVTISCPENNSFISRKTHLGKISYSVEFSRLF